LLDTLELSIELEPKEPWSGILIAELSELGFDSFVETSNGVLAYATPAVDVKELIAKTSVHENDEVKINLETTIIPQQNWNAEWEEQFHPVFVEDRMTIIAPFHKNVEVKGMKVVIQPQMSFGTGHHQTTWLMSKLLFEIDMSDKVLDMGSGTGVLAIVAEKLGANDILAVDIEEWAVENARENIERNDCSNIAVRLGDIDIVEESGFGLILANINKNVLKEHLRYYAEKLSSNGTLMLSGFFHSDVEELEKHASQYGLFVQRVETKEEWAVMQLTKTN
jgi:ribosomal protein L11 methyltransferase